MTRLAGDTWGGEPGSHAASREAGVQPRDLGILSDYKVRLSAVRCAAAARRSWGFWPHSPAPQGAAWTGGHSRPRVCGRAACRAEAVFQAASQVARKPHTTPEEVHRDPTILFAQVGSNQLRQRTSPT